MFSNAAQSQETCWSSTSPALEKQALIWVTGIVTSNPSEAAREKRLKKCCRKVIDFCEDRLGTGYRVKYFFQETSSSLNLLSAKTLKKPIHSFYQRNNYLYEGLSLSFPIMIILHGNEIKISMKFLETLGRTSSNKLPINDKTSFWCLSRKLYLAGYCN